MSVVLIEFERPVVPANILLIALAFFILPPIVAMDIVGGLMTEVAGVLEHEQHSLPDRVRDHNEDAILAERDLGLWIVADGMDGYEAGEVVSAMVVDHIAARVRDGAGLDSARLASAAVIYFLVQRIDFTGTWQITSRQAKSGEQTINKNGVSKTMYRITKGVNNETALH